MPKLYCRVNPRTELEKRDRAGQRFTRNWRELDGIDDATVSALQEDPYLEVSDSPTVLVEVAAASQAGAIETEQDSNNPVKSEATEGSTGEIAAEGADTGTASPVANEGDANLGDADETNALAGNAAGDINTSGDGDAAAVDQSVDASGQSASAQTATGDAQIEAQKETPALDDRLGAIKAAIAQLDPNNAEHWLNDGKPDVIAVSALTGFRVSAAERDQAWNQIKTQAAAE